MGDISEDLIEFVKIVRQNPNQFNQMVENAHKELDGEYSIDAIREVLVEELRIQPPIVVKSSKVVVKRPSLKAHEGEGRSRKSHYREMEQKTAILGVVDKHPKGIVKTVLLRLLRKDNGYWRPILTRWLCEMVDDRVIQTDGNRYFPWNKDYQTRESEIHRRIYECIGSHEKQAVTTTEIAKAIKCNGGKTWHLVEQGLKSLEEMDWIEYKNRRWSWTR